VLLFTLLIRFEIEAHQGLPIIAIPIAVSVLINYWLPPRFTPLLLLSTTTYILFLAFGPIGAGVFLALALLYFFIAHLPLAFSVRVILILLLTLGLVLLRMQIFYMPRLLQVLPWLGSMLMFRFILYMHELKHEKPENKTGLLMRLAYLLVPVNMAMPLFPIIDYKNFLRGHVDGQNNTQRQLALRRILLGICCMLLYRIAYQFLPNAATLNSTSEVAQYILFSYILILRMIALFWMAIGIIGLYGFALPPVFDNPFFITGFGEIWRKINIYWRSFVTKVFYFPIYFKLRKKIRYPVLISSLCVFIITWQLHNWQWFWLRGHFLFKINDLLYWLILGACISFSLSRQASETEIKTVATGWKNSIITILRACGMFLFMSFLWSLWNSSSISEWIFLLSKSSQNFPDIRTCVNVFGLLVVFIAIASVLHKSYTSLQAKTQKWFTYSTNGQGMLVACCGLCLLLISLPAFQQLGSQRVQTAIGNIISNSSNQQDKETAEQGYYEKLVNQSGEPAPWELVIEKKHRAAGADQLIIQTHNLLQRAYKPNAYIRVDERYWMRTNMWGMRDTNYTKEKPTETFRIALLGGSYEMGAGVNNNEIFEAIIEKRLNETLRQHPEFKFQKIELLNFAGGGYHLPQHLWLCDHKIFDFNPDLVLYIAHSEDARRLNGFMSNLIQNGIALEYDYYNTIKKESGARQGQSNTEIRNRLFPYNEKLMRWTTGEMAKRCSKHGARFQLAYLPALADEKNTAELIFWKSVMTELHQQNSLIENKILSLETIWDNINRMEYRISKSNSHPNKKGHERIAQEFYPLVEKVILK
ncbi:MAG: hypothetical protein ACRCYO_03940, partial [Bacteroidia bacterium]